MFEKFPFSNASAENGKIEDEKKEANSSITDGEEISLSRRKFLKRAAGAALAGAASLAPEVVKAGWKQLEEFARERGFEMEPVASLQHLRERMWELAMNDPEENSAFAVKKGGRWLAAFNQASFSRDRSRVRYMFSRYLPFLGENIDDFEEIRQFHTHPYPAGNPYRDGRGYGPDDPLPPAQPSVNDLEALLVFVDTKTRFNPDSPPGQPPLVMEVVSPRYNWQLSVNHDNPRMREFLLTRRQIRAEAEADVSTLSDEQIRRQFLDSSYVRNHPDFKKNPRLFDEVKPDDLRQFMIEVQIQKRKKHFLNKILRQVDEHLAQMSSEEIVSRAIEKEPGLATVDDKRQQLFRAKVLLRTELAERFGYRQLEDKYDSAVAMPGRHELMRIERELWLNEDPSREEELIEKYAAKLKELGFNLTYEKNLRFEEERK